MSTSFNDSVHKQIFIKFKNIKHTDYFIISANYKKTLNIYIYLGIPNTDTNSKNAKWRYPGNHIWENPLNFCFTYHYELAHRFETV